MIGYSILNNIFNQLLSDKLVTKVYHDVIIIEEEKNRFPVFARGDEYIYVGVDDSKKMSCYFRQTGEARNVKTTFTAGCERAYFVKVPYRMVLFNDFEKRNFDSLNSAFVNTMFSQGIDFTALITDRKRLLQDESSPKNFTFGASTYFVAIDFTLSVQISRNNCEEVIIGCDKLPNPVCAIAAPLECVAPTLLAVTEITESQALISWFSVAGATSYNIYYKKRTSGRWIFAATIFDALDFMFTGLDVNTLYDYRVSSNCGDFSNDSFTTLGTDLLTFRYGWSSTPIDLETFDYQYTGTFFPGQDLTTQFIGMPLNVFIAVEYPDSETDKTTWKNTEANYGEIPDFVMNPIEHIGNYKYISSRIELTLDNLFTTIFA